MVVVLQIRGVLEGSEAAAAVLREGDLIVSIDGVPTEAPLGFGEAVQALHGREGTEVSPGIERGGAEPFEVEVERRRIRG
ncbi:MAG: hypothetical protein H6712_28620 [Myxococcales bacterium]|nr:hypothetical protein [Myxococcales bacterium]